MGEYLGGWFTLYMTGVLICVVYFALISAFSAPLWNLSSAISSVSYWLGAALVSIGLLVSALTDSQVLAAVGTFGCMVLASCCWTGISGVLAVGSYLFWKSRCWRCPSPDATAILRRGSLKVPHVLFFVSAWCLPCLIFSRSVCWTGGVFVAE